MKKLVAAFIILSGFSASAQTLFYYGKDSVSAKEFLKAYKKNNTGTQSEKEVSDYLDLYINSRLKIAEAKDRRYDTLPQLIADLQNLRQQILPAYITDKQTIDKMVDEVFIRSQKDIHLAHIFIDTRNADEATATKKLAAVQDGLKKGMAFSDIAKKYSDDPAAATNGGDIGYITVFTLPYELENLAYATPVGKTSDVYKSKAGYHIFKNLGQRKAVGQRKAAEILLAFPPNADVQTKEAKKKQADSLYSLLLKGEDFGKLASQFSNDVISAASNGQMQPFGIGQYDPVFENTVFALPSNGAISKPFVTSHGYHIVKLLDKIPVAATKNEKLLEELHEKVEQSDRMGATKSLLAKKIETEAAYKKAYFVDTELWAYSDSVFNNKLSRTHLQLSGNSPLISFANKTLTVNNWISFAQTARFKSNGSGIKPYPQVWDEFIEASSIDYYQNHLEEFNDAFREQINEFKDGNLFFEIMQRQVWGPAQTDSAALENFYIKNKSKYNWKQSADAIIFYGSDAGTALVFAEELKKTPNKWKEMVTDMSEKIAADSSRFELEQIPNPTNLVWKEGAVTAPLVNKADNSASFAYIVKYYPQSASRNFADARGLVITDYQNELEKNLLAELKKKYPVKINHKALEEIKRKGR